MKYIAEVGGNHLGSLGRAHHLVEAAAKSGATHCKFQTFNPHQMVGDPDYVIPSGPWMGRNLLELYQETCLPRHWHAGLFDHCRELGLVPMSSPFHPDDVEFLESVGCEAYKIASLEIQYQELIRAAAKTGKDLYISTGSATFTDIMEAAVEAWDAGCSELYLLKCTTAYPADCSDANLLTLTDPAFGSRKGTASATGARLGISDHTLGITVPIVATLLGAEVIEKHLTISRQDGGPDSAFSLEPDEFADMVRECKRAFASLGEIRFGPTDAEQDSLSLRRSLWWARDAQAGEVVTRDMIKVARPALGASPLELDRIVGRQLEHDVRGNSPCLLTGSE